MGYSYSSDDGPEMCFNAPKHWQLGWYDDRQTTVSGGWSGDLYGIADYVGTNEGDTVIVQIPGTEDWYVSFNRKTGINSGTPEGGNQVLVHKRSSSSGYGKSDLMAKLNSGNTYSGAPLQITIDAINLSANPAVASVTIGTPTPAPVAAPTPSPTSASFAPPTTTPAPVAAPTPPPTSTPFAPPTTTPAPATPAPAPAPTSSSCSSFNRRGKCNKAQGCGWNGYAKECRDALSALECSAFNNKRWNCKNNGCKWKNKKRNAREGGVEAPEIIYRSFDFMSVSNIHYKQLH